MKYVNMRIVVALLCSATCAPPLFAGDKLRDSDITYWVKDALRHDERVGASKITVSTNDGIVALTGTVKNLAAKNYADLEAKKIKGVRSVENKITVSPGWRSETDIRNAVRRRILNSAVIESESISVTCVDGKVTLAGKVAAGNEREEAGLLASEVRGVKGVKNNITIKYTTTRSDPEIKNDAVAALKRDVYLTDLPITVSVKDGVVTLAGSVGSAYEKDRAARTVRWISPVNKTKNNLNVEWWKDHGVREKKPAPSDDALRQTVRDELDYDARVNASDITTKASYGHITLDGSVFSHGEKRIAEQDARDVVGVGWVTNNLFARVDKREDKAIGDDVDFNLDTDANTEGFDIGVKVKDGIVTLTGSTHTWYEKSHAKSVASRVKGVKKVNNEISVYWGAVSPHKHSGVAVANAIKDRLWWNWTARSVRDQIQVVVKDGVATLTGDVDTWAQRKEAENVAFSTVGVWSVANKLAVKGYDYHWDDFYCGPPLRYDPQLDPFDTYYYRDHGWHPPMK